MMVTAVMENMTATIQEETGRIPGVIGARWIIIDVQRIVRFSRMSPAIVGRVEFACSALSDANAPRLRFGGGSGEMA